MNSRPFVVTVASEKGGVGKTTLATNLAVYLKALHEELPVTVASFDNHFSVDHMFAIGRRQGASVAGLFRGEHPAALVQMGEYGVQYLASERSLTPPDDDPRHLQRVLAASGLGGIVILDTRPIVDYFTCSALLAADLVLAPVKDRPSLVNVATLQRTLEEHAADPARLWLVPSLIDARLKLRDDIGIREFLVCSARERGFQVVDVWIAKSPKVESLATNLTSRVYPILTHARYTVVHQQYKDLADFVLERRSEQPELAAPTLSGAIPRGRLRRLTQECPLCSERGQGARYFFQDLRSRRKGFIHAACLDRVLETSELGQHLPAQGALVFDLSEAGLSAPVNEVAVRLFDLQGEELLAERVEAAEHSAMLEFLQAASGRGSGEFFRDLLLVPFGTGAAESYLEEAGHRTFTQLRRRLVRALLALV